MHRPVRVATYVFFESIIENFFKFEFRAKELLIPSPVFVTLLFE